MKAKTWKPERGDALQGDVILFRVPDDLKIDTSDEIKPEDGRLILASGEVTGHHHAIWAKYTQVAHLHDEALIKADGCARPEPDGLTFPAHEAMWRGLAAKYKAELDNRE